VNIEQRSYAILKQEELDMSCQRPTVVRRNLSAVSKVHSNQVLISSHKTYCNLYRKCELSPAGRTLHL